MYDFGASEAATPFPVKIPSKYGGNTSCIEVRAADHIFIFDAGTGIIELGLNLVKEIEQQPKDTRFVINLVFSHTHHDHIQGLPYFAPAYHDNCTINLFGQKAFSQTLREILTLNMAPQYSPIELGELSASLTFTDISEKDILLFGRGSDSPSLVKRGGKKSNYRPGRRYIPDEKLCAPQNRHICHQTRSCR